MRAESGNEPVPRCVLGIRRRGYASVVSGLRARLASVALVAATAACASAPGPDASNTPDPSEVIRCADAAGTAPEPTETTIFVYFRCADPGVAPDVGAPVPRPAPDRETADRLTLALAELVSGPSAEEAAAGYVSWFSADTAGAVESATFDGRDHAAIDLRDLREELVKASTSAGARTLLAELNAAVFQFGEIATVEYRFEASCDVFRDWLQSAGCVWVSPAHAGELPYALDCGPMQRTDCERHARQIAERAGRNHPGRTVVSVHITGPDGDYDVLLDDGTAIIATFN